MNKRSNNVRTAHNLKRSNLEGSKTKRNNAVIIQQNKQTISTTTHFAIGDEIINKKKVTYEETEYIKKVRMIPERYIEEVVHQKEKTETVPAAEVWKDILHELAERKIVYFAIDFNIGEYSGLIGKYTGKEDCAFYAEQYNIKLLNRVKNLCFCKINSQKEKDHVIINKKISEIKEISLTKIDKYDRIDVYIMSFSDSHLYWNMYLEVTCRKCLKVSDVNSRIGKHKQDKEELKLEEKYEGCKTVHV